MKFIIFYLNNRRWDLGKDTVFCLVLQCEIQKPMQVRNSLWLKSFSLVSANCQRLTLVWWLCQTQSSLHHRPSLSISCVILCGRRNSLLTIFHNYPLVPFLCSVTRIQSIPVKPVRNTLTLPPYFLFIFPVQEENVFFSLSSFLNGKRFAECGGLTASLVCFSLFNAEKIFTLFQCFDFWALWS